MSNLSGEEKQKAEKLIKRTQHFLDRQKEYLANLVNVDEQGLPKGKMMRSVKKETAVRGNIRNLYKILKRVNLAGQIETVIVGCVMCGTLKSTIWRHLFPDSNIYDNPFICNRCYDVFKTFTNDPRLTYQINQDGSNGPPRGYMSVIQLLEYLFDYPSPRDNSFGKRQRYVLRPIAQTDDAVRKTLYFHSLLSGEKQDKVRDSFITGYNYKATFYFTLLTKPVENYQLEMLPYDFNLTLDSGRQKDSLRRKKIDKQILNEPIEKAKNGVVVFNNLGIKSTATNSPFSNETHYTPYGGVWRIMEFTDENGMKKNIATLTAVKDSPGALYSYDRFKIPYLDVFNINRDNIVRNFPMVVFPAKSEIDPANPDANVIEPQLAI